MRFDRIAFAAMAGLAFAGALSPAPTRANVEVIIGGPTPTPAPVVKKPKPHHSAPASPAPLLSGQSAEGTRTSQAIVRYALEFLGRPYLWGGITPGGFDCSGYTWFTFHMLGVAIPRTADEQFAWGQPVHSPLPGDLVFFQTYDYGASHVGIYLGRGMFVSSIGSDVHVSSFDSYYFRSRYLGARRVARVE